MPILTTEALASELPATVTIQAEPGAYSVIVRVEGEIESKRTYLTLEEATKAGLQEADRLGDCVIRYESLVFNLS